MGVGLFSAALLVRPMIRHHPEFPHRSGHAHEPMALQEPEPPAAIQLATTAAAPSVSLGANLSYDLPDDPEINEAPAIREERPRLDEGPFIQPAAPSAEPPGGLSALPDHAAALWRSSQECAARHQPELAITGLERLLAESGDDGIRPAALGLMCECLDAAGCHEAVLRFARECIDEFPDDPACLLARYHLARAQIMQQQFQEAEHNLLMNLDDPELGNHPQLAQQNRLVLAMLLHDLGREDEAIRWLRPILRNPLDADSSAEAQFLMADCVRRRAGKPARLLEQARTHEARTHYERYQRESLREALGLWSRLREHLEAREQADRASATELRVLQRSRWAIADCYYEMESYDTALPLYGELAESSPSLEGWLEAQVQIANCYARMDQLQTARAVMREACARVQRLPAEAADQLPLHMASDRRQDWEYWKGEL